MPNGTCGETTLEAYDLPLHIGAVFIVLATSGIGVGVPLITGWIRGSDGKKASASDAAAIGKHEGWVRNGFFIARHFGTGIILSTSFIHLLYEGLITFADPCIGESTYDPIAPAIALAGAYITFILDFVGGRQRIASVKRQLQAMPLPIAMSSEPNPHIGRDDKDTVNGSTATRESTVHMRAHQQQQQLQSQQTPSRQESQDGVLQAMAHGGCGDEHDAVFRAEQGWQVLLLEAGIIFHSIMIGVTLGADSGEGWNTLLIVIVFHQFFEGAALGARIAVLTWISKLRAFLMGLAFTLITPVGIAIGIGVRTVFSHNGAAELISIGVLNSFSAGILLYTAFKLVQQDFTEGPLREAPMWKPLLAMALIAVGMVAMAVIGKWA